MRKKKQYEKNLCDAFVVLSKKKREDRFDALKKRRLKNVLVKSN